MPTLEKERKDMSFTLSKKSLKKLNPNVKPREMKIGSSLKIPRTGGTK